MEIIQSIIGFFIAIGILVTFHEFGHFYIARLFNVKVLNFSIGFGKTLYKKKFSEDGTEYSVGLIPLGGYVKMLESHEIKDEPSDLVYKNCFDKQSVYKRFLIVAAGPIFNLILAIIFFTFVHFSGITGMKPYIQEITNSENNIIMTDKKNEIIAVNDVTTKRWQDVRVEVLNTIVNGDDLLLKVKTDNVINNINIIYDKDVLKQEGDVLRNIGIIPKQPLLPPIIGDVQDDSPASLAGLKKHDNVLSINNEPVNNWNSLSNYIQNNPDEILQLKISRENDILDIILVPSRQDNNFGYAGISAQRKYLDEYRVLVQYPLLDSINKSFRLTYDYSILTFKMIFELFTGQANINNISGPLSIAEFSGKSLSMGAVYFAYLLAILSISLGVLNLLPIPMLDGGHLVYYIIEMVIGRPVSDKIQLVAQQFGLAILLGIMILAFYNDFTRLL